MKFLLFLIVSPPLISAGNYSPFGNLCPKIPYTTSADVINNLASFSSLYVKYGNCAYSIQSNGENQGGGGGGDEGWYMGYQFTRGANVAYSLYGSRTGFGGCAKSSFINSFYTLDGLTTFVQSVGLTISDIYPYAYYQGGDGEGGGDHNNNGGCTSALICGEDKKQSNYFIQASFTDGMCNLNGYSETTDILSNLNSALNKQSCVKIDQSTALTLLTYSQTCTALSGSQCPDPNGLLADCESKYVGFDQFTLNEGIDSSKPYRYIFGSVLYVLALALVGYTFLLMRKKQQEKSVDNAYISHDSYEPPTQAYAPSRQLSIQSVAHSVAESVKSVAHSVKGAITSPASEDAGVPLGTMSSESTSPKPKKRGPFALLRRGRNRN